MASPIDYTGNDRLLNAMRYRESVENRIHRAEQTEIQWNGLMLEQERNDLGKIAAQRQQDQDRLDVWNKTRAEEATSYAAKSVMEIDVSTPEGEKKLGDWMSYVRANGVGEDSVKTLFGTKLNEITIRKEKEAEEESRALGNDGILLYKALKNSGVDTESSRNFASKSSQAQQTLAKYQKYAEEKGVAFVLDESDWASITQRVGQAPTVPIGSGSFDPRPVYYDLEAVNRVISKKFTPEMAKMVKQDTDAAERKAQLETAQIAKTNAETEQAKANAVKANFEAGVYRNVGTPGATSPGRTPSPASDLFTN
jgi:hypothetical protein